MDILNENIDKTFMLSKRLINNISKRINNLDIIISSSNKTEFSSMLIEISKIYSSTLQIKSEYSIKKLNSLRLDDAQITIFKPFQTLDTFDCLLRP